MDPQELARQIALLAASDDPELQAQAQEIVEGLKRQERDRAIFLGADGQGVLQSVFSSLSNFGSRVGGAVASFTDNLGAELAAEPLFNQPAPEGLIGSQVGQGIGQGIRSGFNALTYNPQAEASRLLAEQQAQINQGPLQGLGPDLQQRAAGAAANQTIAGFVPGQGLGPDIQQQAAAYAANQAGALQGINQQAALVSQLQAGQLQSYVQQEELKRQSELLGLMQNPAVNPNALTNAAAFSQAPAVGTAPNNLTTLLPQQASLGSVDIASLLPAAQTNLKQRQRTIQNESPFINTSVQQQERALELARQQYIDDVSRKIMARTR